PTPPPQVWHPRGGSSRPSPRFKTPGRKSPRNITRNEKAKGRSQIRPSFVQRSMSPPHRIPSAPRISARLNQLRLRIVNDNRRRRCRGEVIVHDDLVPAPLHLFGHLVAETFFQAQTAGIETVIGKRADEVRGLEPRGLDRLLRIHSEFDHVEQSLQ